MNPSTVFFVIEKTIKYKKGPVASKRAGFVRFQACLRDCLARELPELLNSPAHRTLLETPWSKPIEDQTGSVLCALIAYLHLRFGENRTEVLGNDAAGHILLPRPIGGAET
jgi:predicted RNase H-like nuclease